MRKVVCAACLVVISVSALTAQTYGSWERVYSALMAQDMQNAHGHANVGFSPGIMSVPDNPFTATRIYTDQRTENGQDVGSPLTAECTIARDEKGRIHYEMAFESGENGKLLTGGFDIQIYDPVAHTLTRYFAKPDHSLPPEPIAEVRRLKLMSELEKPVAPSAAKTQGAEEDQDASAETDGSYATNRSPAPPPIKFIPTKDNLPKQFIDGMPIVIRRSILKYGDKQQFFQIQEDWLSPEYAMDLRRTVLRETIGKETVETKDIVQGAPDPALFEIPPGYLVHIEK